MDFGQFDFGGGGDDGGYVPGEPGYDPGGSGGGGGDEGPPQFSIDPKTGLLMDAQGNLYDPNTGMPVGNSSGGMPPGMGGPGDTSGLMGALSKIFGNGKGDINWPMLLSMLGVGGGALMGLHATNKATDQMQGGITKASDLITKMLGESSGAFKPFTDMGAAGAARLSALPQSNLAAQFGPLAGSFGPLGNGRGITGAPKSFASLYKGG